MISTNLMILACLALQAEKNKKGEPKRVKICAVPTQQIGGK